MESTKYYLGLDVGGTNMVAGVVDENHQIIAKESIPTQAGRTIEDMAEVSKKAVLKAGLQMEDISSWGIGMPSYVNPKTNLLVHANCFGWKNVPIYDYLKKHISLPTYIANDANCATYGEVLAGSASQYTDAIMLTLGTGVGGGIIMGKRIYSGADNMGAELGHTKLVYNGERCTCGQKGCLEAYCSSTALIRIMKEALQENKDTLIWKLCGEDENKVNGEILFEAAKQGDSLAKQIVDDYISKLAAGISTFITIFRPQVIILGGGIAHAGDLLLKPLNEKLHTCTFAAEEIGIPQVIRAELGNDAGIIGAALEVKNGRITWSKNMKTNKKELLDSFKGGLIVSCQVQHDDPTFSVDFVVKMAKAAQWGGAVGIRANDPEQIKAIKKEVDLPVIGLWKIWHDDTDVFITPTLEAAKAVWEAGAEIIALDCTSQITHEGRPAYELLPIVKKEIPEAIIFADVSNYEEAVRAVEMGADIVGPTLYGYTEATKHIEQPDLREFARMCRDFKDKAYVIMEGHIYSPEDAMKCIFLGAHSVVVGSAITRPHLITKRFTDLLTGYQNNWREAERSKH
mgnify:CR=1 FL=1